MAVMVGRPFRWFALGATVAACLLASSGCGQEARAAGFDRAGPPPAPREFRAAWVATVDNIDWPSRPGLPVAQQRSELDRILDTARDLHLNALIFQVRPACDAFYRSELEPWSEWLTGKQGKEPSPLWDPLEHAVAGAHTRGLELHAWFNPYRARHPAADTPLTEDHFARRAGMAVEYGEYLWLDPGRREVQEHALAVILDVVARYDVDGIHLDDYFYPYPSGGKDFPDSATYGAYRNGGGRLDRDDWRRDNVDRFVAALDRRVHEAKPWVKVGISPFGILRPGVPAGIEAGIDQYDDLYADVARWLDRGWCDYISPQLYWPIAQTAQSYPKLLRHWASLKPDDCHLWIGNFATKAATGAKGWSTGELERQIELTRGEPRATGNVQFSFKVLRDDTGGLARVLREGPYRLPALVPASPWLDAEAPSSPSIRLDEGGAGDLEIRWSADADARWRAVYLLCGDRWLLIEVVPGHKPGLLVTAAERRKLGVRAVAVSSVDRCGNESPRALAAVR